MEYDLRFEGIVSDDEEGVSFTINGTHASTPPFSLPPTASTVRYASLSLPGIEPYYTGTTAIIAHIPRASVAWPYDDYERNATIQGKPSAIFFIPEDPEAKTIMTGLSKSTFPEQSRAGP